MKFEAVRIHFLSDVFCYHDNVTVYFNYPEYDLYPFRHPIYPPTFCFKIDVLLFLYIKIAC